MALAGLSKSEKDEHSVCFAALALHDGGAEINADSIKAMVEATGNEVEAYWPMIAAKFFTSGDNCKNLIVKPGGSGGGGGGGGGGGDAGGEAEKEEEKKEEEEEEEIDMAGGMDMFGGEGGGDDY